MKIYIVIFFVTMMVASFGSLMAQEKKTVVFVCEHGAARSTIASLYFNKLAQENGLHYQSVFRALSRDTALTKETKNGLIKDGFSIDNLKTVNLTATDVNSNTLLISLDCVVPSIYTTKYSWSGIPPISEDYQAARNEIVKRVNKLISELKNEK
jgi:protein-tyrosine-phosphatase